MSITNELMEWASSELSYKTRFDELIAIADRIDAEHQKAMDELRAIGNSMWQRGYGVCHDELMEGHPVVVADLEKCGWVHLPKDADGEYIHIGDVMEGVNKYDSLKKIKGEVITVSFESDGTVDVAIQAWNSDGKSWHRAYLDPDASIYRHYHEPTVEDVLGEFFEEVGDGLHTLKAVDTQAIIAKYAAKLQLANVGE